MSNSSEEEYKSLPSDLSQQQQSSALVDVSGPVSNRGFLADSDPNSKVASGTSDSNSSSDSSSIVGNVNKQDSGKELVMASTVRFDFHKLNIPLFDGKDFVTWQWSIMNYFKANELDQYFKNETVTVHEKIKATINVIFMQSMTPAMLLHVIHLDHPYKQWKALCDVHEHSSSDRAQQLLSEFFSSRMDPSEDVSRFLSRMRDIQSQLKQLKKSLDDDVMIAGILQKLPSAYNSFVEAWYQSNSDSDFDTLQSKLLQTQSRILALNSNSSSYSESTALNTTRRDDGRSSQDVADVNDFVCFYCGNKGHIRRNCRKLQADRDNGCVKKDKVSRPRRGTNEELDGGSNSQQSDEEEDDDQARGYALVVNEALVTSSPGSAPVWIADTGATKHMCCVKEWFCDLDLTPQVDIRTATDSPVTVLGRGSVRVKSCGLQILLENVLYVPTLSNCLLSLGTVADRGLITNFNGNSIEILSRGKLIAKASKSNSNLYQMDFEPLLSVFNTINAEPSLVTESGFSSVNIIQVSEENIFADASPASEEICPSSSRQEALWHSAPVAAIPPCSQIQIQQSDTIRQQIRTRGLIRSLPALNHWRDKRRCAQRLAANPFTVQQSSSSDSRGDIINSRRCSNDISLMWKKLARYKWKMKKYHRNRLK